MKKSTYIFGLASGVVLATFWKSIVREGVKIGVKVGREVKRVSAETLEDMEDATAEAMQDLAEQDQADKQHPEGARKRKPMTN